MLSKSELTSRLLAALPSEAAATANRLICLEPDFQSACREPDFLRALLQRDDVAETTAWRPAALGLVALTQSTESDIGDGLAWLTTTNPGRNYALGALTQLTAPEADPVRRLANLVAVAAEVRRRFFDSAGDWLPVLHATLDRATEMPAGVLYC
ncbi:MAG: hypothetical protein ACE5FI_14330, partial [Anaerolineales bacterium]